MGESPGVSSSPVKFPGLQGLHEKSVVDRL